MIRYLDVVLNVPLNQTFTYATDEKTAEAAAVGKRAEVRFGNRLMTSFIVAAHETLPPNLAVSPDKIKPIQRLIDKEPVFTDEQIALSNWISRYYLCSPGEALSAMIPSGRRETGGIGFAFEAESPDTTARVLSDEQKKAARDVLANSGDNAQKLHYLFGATGSGKTEVFLQIAEETLKAGKGVIYLVPEIALTHQVIQAVASRFGKTVAALHSALTPSERLSEWRRILSKEARVVIGARSAVFAPVPDLGLIIIDEEHDGSYKSGNTPRYHARQVAIKRCKDAGIPLVMGSATPSAEAWHLMDTGIIVRHVLTKRLSGGKPPEIEVVNLMTEHMDGCISDTLRFEIDAALLEGRQTILFLNRRGYTNFFRCNTCGFEFKCKNCSVALTYHKHEHKLKCHYCGWTQEPVTVCPECRSLDIGYTGFGTEFIETEVKAKFPHARIDRLDIDNLKHKGELAEKMAAFRNGDIDILLGTQMVAKGLNFPRLKVVGVVLADTGLTLPDFRAGERTFALITQVAGRTGRFFPDGKVIVQSFSPEREAVALACSGNIEEFYRQELSQREMLRFPPFSRLIRLVFRSPDRKKAAGAATGAAEILVSEAAKRGITGVEIMGPSECPLEKIAANYRMQILLRAEQTAGMQNLCASFLYGYKAPYGVYIEVDTDPVSLL